MVSWNFGFVVDGKSPSARGPGQLTLAWKSTACMLFLVCFFWSGGPILCNGKPICACGEPLQSTTLSSSCSPYLFKLMVASLLVEKSLVVTVVPVVVLHLSLATIFLVCVSCRYLDTPLVVRSASVALLTNAVTRAKISVTVRGRR